MKEFHYWGIYLGFNSILMCLCFSFIHLARFHSPNIPFQKILLFWGWILFFVGLCEQLRLFLMPGSDPFSVIVRPSSLLGSMLHYPLVISVIAFCLLQWGVEKKKKNYFLSGLFFCFIPFTTLSRSGVLVVLLSLIFYLSMRSCLSYRRLFKYTIYVVCGVGFFFCLALSLNNESVIGSLFNRVLFASTIESGENSERVLAWSRGVNLWLDTNLFFGEYTGMVTRASGSVFRDVKFRGVESGALQLLLNFGFLGALLFYSLFIFLYRRIHKEHYFLKAVFIAGLVQGLFHASIEVFSYMVCLGILPFISQTYKRYQV